MTKTTPQTETQRAVRALTHALTEADVSPWADTQTWDDATARALIAMATALRATDTDTAYDQLFLASRALRRAGANEEDLVAAEDIAARLLTAQEVSRG